MHSLPVGASMYTVDMFQQRDIVTAFCAIMNVRVQQKSIP